MTKNEQEWAIFWCSVLHAIIFGEVGQGEVYRKLRELSRTEILFPDGKKKKPSLSTLKRKLKKYREVGFDGLPRKKRKDRGKSRKYQSYLIEKAVDLKKDQPMRSHVGINFLLNEYHGITIPASTLYRYLRENGATRLKLGVVQKKVRCRWTRQKVNELWIGDFSDGPYVSIDGQVLPTDCSIFIDCCSRDVICGRYYLRKNLDVLIDTLLRGFAEQDGIPQEIYVDNAKVYHAKALKAACYGLKIKLIHRKKGDPSPGGLIEAMIGTLQSQFEAEVKAGEILDLDTLNQAFTAYIQTVYRKTVHSEIKQTPEHCFLSKENVKRRVDLDHVIRFFLHEDFRKVHKDFADISFRGRFYKADPSLRGDKVIVRYDPFSDLDQVFLYSLDETYLGIAPSWDRTEKREDSQTFSVSKPKYNFVDAITKKHKTQIQNRVNRIDFVRVMESKRWPFLSFIQEMALALGKKGGINAFCANDIETLKKAYDRFPELNKAHLYLAAKNAAFKNIPHIILQIQKQF